MVIGKVSFDKVSANTASSGSKISEFQSGHRVVKKVLNFALNRKFLRKKFIGIYVVYFGWCLVNPHAQAVQNICARGVRGCFS